MNETVAWLAGIAAGLILILVPFAFRATWNIGKFAALALQWQRDSEKERARLVNDNLTRWEKQESWNEKFTDALGDIMKQGIRLDTAERHISELKRKDGR